MKPVLIGDIGATHARFAIVSAGKAAAVKILDVAAYPSFAEAIKCYLGDAAAAKPKRPLRGVVAVAGPVTGDKIAFTNHPWSFSINDLKRRLSFDRLEIVNDFVAAAIAVPHFKSNDYRQIGSGKPVAETPIGIIGPGSGLGVSGLIPVTHKSTLSWTPLAGEGGHATLPAANAKEADLIDWMRRSGNNHVSAETFLCGPGLSNLYAGLSALDGDPTVKLQPAEVTSLAANHTDARAVEAVQIFCALLGTVAGNLALTIGARGGVYIAGGIVPQLGGLVRSVPISLALHR